MQQVIAYIPPLHLNQELTAVCIFKNRSLFTLIKQSCELQIFLTLPHLSHIFFFLSWIEVMNLMDCIWTVSGI